MRLHEPVFRAIQSPDLSPIFVVGTGRSGTTLLRQMLNAHERIHITHEAGFYTYALHASPWVSAEQFLARYCQTFSFAWLHVRPEDIRKELPPRWDSQDPKSLAEVFAAVMRAKAKRVGKPRYGEKNPLDTQNLGRIFADFPDARVVFVMRDPRPTVASFNKVPFSTSSALLNTFLCKVQFDHVKPYLDRVLEVRLEDLSSDPRRVMEIILAYLGEPFSEAVLDHVNHAETKDVPPLPWFQGATRRRPTQEDRDGFLADLSPTWVRLIESINKDAMEHYGYPKADLQAEPDLAGKVSALAKDIPGMAQTAYRLLLLKRRIYRHFDGEEILDPQDGMEESINMNPAAWKHFPGFTMPKVPRWT